MQDHDGAQTDCCLVSDQAVSPYRNRLPNSPARRYSRVQVNTEGRVMAMGAASGVLKTGRAGRRAAFNRVSTGSVDAAAEAIGRIFCPHELKPLRQSSPDF